VLLQVSGCETWSLILREEHRLRGHENTVLRRIFGPKRDEIIGGWKIFHNEELYKLDCSPNWNDHVKENEMSRACGTHERRDAYRVL
jgi:hypothetical protein